MSISLDGYVAGPDQNLEHPLGRGGIKLHRWHLDEPLNDADTRARDLLLRPRGAYVMGRNMFGPLRGSWQDDWRGWWGEEPPYHAPVFVLTHFEHDPIEMAGATTFHFVTNGFDAAFARASEAAGDRGVDIAGSHAHSLVPVPHTPRPPKHSAHDGQDAAGDQRLHPGRAERSSARETCMNRGIEAIVVTSPAPSRDHLSARTAPVATRLTPTPEPTPSEREPTSQNPPLLCSLAGGGLGPGALMVR
jgi:dihydrofolate reductase